MRIRQAAGLATPFVFALAAVAADAPKPAPPATREVTKAEARFKNIKAFKGYPSDEVFPAMQFMSAALGVDCEYCHVDREPERDDKKEKEIARKMIAMTLAINQNNFGGRVEVTCMSCHRGATHPVSVPFVAAAETGEQPAAPKPATLPAAGAVLDKYAQAVGGTEALAKIKTRVQNGKISGFGPGDLPIDVVSEAPLKRVTIVHNPRGQNIAAYDGQRGWMFNTGQPARDMSPFEEDNARMDAAILFSSDLKRLFKEFKVAAFDTIDGKAAVKVLGLNDGKPPVELWFDVQSGLIVRVMRFAQTLVGPNPTEVAFADFRAVDGVTIPFRWTVARPSGRFTVQLEESLQNAPVDARSFEKPAQGPPS